MASQQHHPTGAQHLSDGIEESSHGGVVRWFWRRLMPNVAGPSRVPLRPGVNEAVPRHDTA